MDLDDEELEATRKMKGLNPMNNIEILELFIKSIRSDLHDDSEDNQETADAIENLLQEYNKLKKQMGKDLDMVYIQGVYDEKNKWKNKIKEELEHYKDTGYNELEEVLQELLGEGE